MELASTHRYPLTVWMGCLLVWLLGGTSEAVPLPPDVEIARFLYDRPAAFSLTFDDALDSHITEAVPILDRHGLRGTFFLYIDNVGDDRPSNWDAWRRVAESGHEVSSHSQTHLNMENTSDPDILEFEIVGSFEIIKEKTGIEPLSFAYPYSAKNDYVMRLVGETYAFDRSDCRVWGGDAFDTAMGKRHVERAIQRREWDFVMLHGVGEETWGALEPETLDVLCAYLAEREDQIWTDTYARVATYVRRRNAAEVLRRNVESDSFEFRLRLPDRDEFEGLADVPLTVRIPLDGRDPQGIRGTLAGDTLSLRTCEKDQFLLAEVPVDAGWVKIYW